MIETFKALIDALSTPTISFTILTVLAPFLFPPTDWFDKINRKLGLWRLWTKAGCAIGMAFITFFFIIGYFFIFKNINYKKYFFFKIIMNY